MAEEGRGLHKLLEEVGAAAAVGRVPMPLWQEARERYVLFPPYKPAVHKLPMLPLCCTSREIRD